MDRKDLGRKAHLASAALRGNQQARARSIVGVGKRAWEALARGDRSHRTRARDRWRQGRGGGLWLAFFHRRRTGSQSERKTLRQHYWRRRFFDDIECALDSGEVSNPTPGRRAQQPLLLQ